MRQHVKNAKKYIDYIFGNGSERAIGNLSDQDLNHIEYVLSKTLEDLRRIRSR